MTSPPNPMIESNAIGWMTTWLLTTGEKVQPMVLEMMLSEHSFVSAAGAFGEGHLQLGSIVKPSHAASSVGLLKFKTSIWPTVLEANQLRDAHAWIASKEAISVVHQTVTLPTSDKRSLLRRELYAMLNGEIERAYQQLESPRPPGKNQIVHGRNGDIKTT